MPSPPCRLCLGASVLLWSLWLPSHGAAQTVDPVKLDAVVNAADRLPETGAVVGTDNTVITPDDLAREQLDTLADALNLVPGVSVFANGREGAWSSIFVRGADSDQVLILVDGIRFNDANTFYGPFIGGWRVNGGDALEVDRGPQSALYGGSSGAGLVALSTPPGKGSPSESIDLDAGTFGTIQATLQAQGTGTGIDYRVADSAGTTDNGRANNRFTSNNLTLRLDYRLDPAVVIGATLRALNDNYGNPGTIDANNLYNHDREEDLIGTLFANVSLGQNFTGKVTLGGVFRDFETFESLVQSPAEGARERNERGVLASDVIGRVTANDTLTVGADRESAITHDDSFGSIDARETLTAYYAEDVFAPTPEITATAAIRRDDTNTWGAVDTGRATLAWLGASHFLKLRGSYGTGFNEPSLFDLYGVGSGYVGNPHLQPERSRGWDAGLDFYLPEDASQVLSVTWFNMTYSNLIEDNFAVNPVTAENIGRARARGLDVAWTTRFAGAVQAKLGYTYLTAQDLTIPIERLRPPRDTFTADLFLDAKNGFMIGTGFSYVGQRADVAPVTFDAVNDPPYTLVRVYAQYRFNGHWAIHARVENALDHRYSPVNGYPGLPLQVIGGVDFRL